jgi:alkanesulfonate monooxygenase SsuD/methylene tetrahydromethanopterin reductase-like flavin-dependent oxidoreductase (luciferase family)
VLIGGHGEKALQRVVEWGDGWIPLSIEARKELPGQVEQLQRMAAEAGREPIEVTLFGARQRAEALERLEKVGVARAVFWLDPGSPDEVLPQLDELAKLV